MKISVFACSLVAALMACDAGAEAFRVTGTLNGGSFDLATDDIVGDFFLADGIGDGTWTGPITVKMQDDFDVGKNSYWGFSPLMFGFEFASSPEFVFDGTGHLLSGTAKSVVDGGDCQICVAGGTLTIVGGKFTEDPGAIEGASIAAGHHVENKGTYYEIVEGGGSEPKGALALNDATTRSAMSVDPSFETGFDLAITADEKALAAYGAWKVDILVTFDRGVPASAAVFGVRSAPGWAVSTNAAEIAVEEGRWLLGASAQTLNDAADAGLSCALGQVDAALKGTKASVQVWLLPPSDGVAKKLGKAVSHVFNEGYYGPKRPAGEPLPVTGRDVLGLFTFDDASARGKNSGVTGSAISSFGTAAFGEGRFGGAALFLASADDRVAGTFVTGVEGRTLPEIPVTLARPTGNASRLAGDKAWAVAFWFKPDPSAKPAAWSVVEGAVSPELARLFDGGWHHLAVTFNARAWVESSNPFEVYCDGGHWNGDVGTKTDNGWACSWHGKASEISLPLTVDPATGAFELGGSIDLTASGVQIAIPLVGAVDDFIVLSRWLAPDDVRCLYRTGDAYVTHVFPDVIGADGLNGYKDWTGCGQLWSDNAGRGTFDSNYGWSTYCSDHAHWQTDAARACDDSAASADDQGRIYGYDTSFCDCLVDHNGELVAQSQFASDVFPGASLTLGRIGGGSGSLYLRTGRGGSSERTVEDLRLNNGCIRADAARQMTLGGALTVNAPAAAPFRIVPDSTAAQSLVIGASVAGVSGTGLAIGDGEDGADFTVALDGDLSGYAGALTLNHATVVLPASIDDAGMVTKTVDLTGLAGAVAGEGKVLVDLTAPTALADGKYLLARLRKSAGVTVGVVVPTGFTGKWAVRERTSEKGVTRVWLRVGPPPPPGTVVTIR